MGSTLKGKNLLPLGSKFFPFREEPFFGCSFVYRNANRKSQKLSPVWRCAEWQKICQVYLDAMVVLTFKVPITTAADDIFFYFLFYFFFFYFQGKQVLADNSHEMSRLIFSEK